MDLYHKFEGSTSAYEEGSGSRDRDQGVQFVDPSSSRYSRPQKEREERPSYYVRRKDYRQEYADEPNRGGDPYYGRDYDYY
jgi:hypothetical protein